jgi:hypothetical protein
LGTWAPFTGKFGSVSEQSAHEVVSGIPDAVNRATDVLIFLLFCAKVFNTQTASVKFTTYKIFTEGQAAGATEIATRFDSLMSLFLRDTKYD